jgi:hypothetical protein
VDDLDRCFLDLATRQAFKTRGGISEALQLP